MSAGLLIGLWAASPLFAAHNRTTGTVAAPSTDPAQNDKVGTYDWIRPQADFVRREMMVPMRDGLKLYTVIVFRKGTHDAPILLSRTPYNAAATTARNRS